MVGPEGEMSAWSARLEGRLVGGLVPRKRKRRHKSRSRRGGLAGRGRYSQEQLLLAQFERSFSCDSDALCRGSFHCFCSSLGGHVIRTILSVVENRGASLAKSTARKTNPTWKLVRISSGSAKPSRADAARSTLWGRTRHRNA